MPLNLKVRIFFLLLFLLPNLLWAKSYEIKQIPDPKINGQFFYVSNPDHILSSSDVAWINAICADIDTVSRAEVAVVVVNDFKGENLYDFALDLFNHWGIGKADVNNGLLLFIAIDRSNYYFITGDGMEGVLNDAKVTRIGRNYLVPHFKNQDYGKGIVAAMEAISHELKQPNTIEEFAYRDRRSPLQKVTGFFVDYGNIIFVLGLSMITLLVFRAKTTGSKRNRPFGLIIFFLLAVGGMSIFLYLIIKSFLPVVSTRTTLPIIIWFVAGLFITVYKVTTRNKLLKGIKDHKNRFQVKQDFNRKYWWTIFSDPLMILGLLLIYNEWRKLQKRLVPPDNSGTWERMDRDKIRVSKILTPGQKSEEKAKSYSYEIWKKIGGDKYTVIPFADSENSSFDACPSCGFCTYKKPYLVTIEEATYSSRGRGIMERKCVHCKFEQQIREVILPKLSRSSSSGGSSSSGSSGGSSSGSWGGGRSSGGGGGGSW